MTIHRKKYDGPIDFECDECGEVLETGDDEFKTALEMAKDEGWYIRNLNGEWHHFCGRGCYQDFRY
jgi:hypothetical protein